MRDITNYAKEYQKESFERYQVKYRRKMLLERIDYWTDCMGHPLNILEVGIGLEPLFQFADTFGEWTCVEPASAFVEHAESICLPNVRIVQGLVEECTKQLQKSHYDLIIISSLLHEVERPDNLLAAIRAVAGKETVIHINVPNANSFHRLLARESGLIVSVTDFSERNHLFQQHSVFDADSLINMIQSQGEICVEKKGSYFLKPFSHGQMEKMLDNGIISEEILDGLYNLNKYFPQSGSEIFVEYRVS